MTVISHPPGHAHLNKLSFPFQSQDNIGWKSKISPNKTGYTNRISMNSKSGEDGMNITEQYEIVTSDSVDMKDAVRKIKLRVVGRRKSGQQKNGKENKVDNGGGYGRKNGSQQKRITSQGNGSSGMEGSGEGSGNGDESSDDDDDDGEDGEDEPDEEEEEEEEEDEEDDDEMEEEIEEDTDVSPVVEDEIDETRSGCSVDNQPLQRSLELKRLEFENPGPKVASGTLLSSEKIEENTEEESGVENVIASPGTPVTLSGVIWKETMGGVLVVNLKWRNKTYCGSLIDHSQHGWATPRNLDVGKESNMSTSKRGKGRKGKHKGSAYTGNPLSPKMTGNDKRDSRFLHNKDKHGKDSVVRPRTKGGLGSDNTEEGTRTRRRSCTVKTSVSPSPSPTPLIECPERNCNKKYKHINGLRYHQAHAHLDSVVDPDDKDSDDEEETKPNDFKEPSSVNSKSSSSDDIKPLSRRKAKNQKVSKHKSSENGTVQDSVENEDISEEGKEEKCSLENIKVEPVEQVKTERHISPGPNIIQEAAKIIFDEPTESEDITCDADAGILYVGYDTITASKMNEEIHAMDVTIKEEVIDEGNAGMGKITCNNEAEETLDNTEEYFNKEKSEELTMENEKIKWVTEKEVAFLENKSSDGVTVNKEMNQQKTSAAEIRSLPGYQHFRIYSNNGSLTQTLDEKSSKTFESRLNEGKEPPKNIPPLKWNSGGGTPRQQGMLETQENVGVSKKPVVWKMHGAPSASSFHISVATSKKPSAGSIVTASTTWVPEVHPAVSQKMGGGNSAGQEVVPVKPFGTRESRIEPGESSLEGEEDEKTGSRKSDEEKPKASFSGKSGRAVGVAHPFNSEKYNLGSLGSFSSEPVKVLYSKSSSPKISLDLTEAEVKKVRVEKTLVVPIGEVLPLAKSSRSAVAAIDTRHVVVVGSEATGHYSGVLTTMSENGTPQPVDADSPRDLNSQNSDLPTVTEGSSPWRPTRTYSPSRDSESRPLRDSEPSTPRDSIQRCLPAETISSPSRKTSRRSPALREGSPFRGSPNGYTAKDAGVRTPEKDTNRMFHDKRVPFMNFDERISRGGKNIGRTPEKDTSGRLEPERGTGERMTYRDSERRSPQGPSVSQFREFNRSPHRDTSRADQRSPVSDVTHRAFYRDTSPNPPTKDIARRSPYKVKQGRDGESLGRSPENKSFKSEGRTSKEAGESSESRHVSTDRKFPRLTNEEAMMFQLRQRQLYQFQTMSQENAARDAMDNYMMYMSRLPIHAAIDPRFLPPYPMLSPQIFQPSGAEGTLIKEERAKVITEEPRSKSNVTKNENQRIKATVVSETSDIELVATKRHLDSSGPSVSKESEKIEYESTPPKKTKSSEVKDVQEIMEGNRMQYKKLEHQVLQQQHKQKVDAFVQLQTEASLKQKAEEKRNNRSRSSSTSSSRLKSGAESRSKKEDVMSSASKPNEKEKTQDEKARLSPAARQKSNTTGEPLRLTSRNSENKSPPSGSYPGFLSTQSLPANHGLSNSYEQATFQAMQGISPFLMSPAFQLAPGMMSNHLVTGAQFQNAITSRGVESKRETSRSSSSTTTDRGRTKDDERRTKEEERRDTREFSGQTKNDNSSNKKNISRNITPPPSKQKHEKERDREGTPKLKEYDEDKQCTSRDNPTQGLPSNLAFRRGNMSGIDGTHLNQAFPRLMYPPAQGFRTQFERPYSPYSRK